MDNIEFVNVAVISNENTNEVSKTEEIPISMLAVTHNVHTSKWVLCRRVIKLKLNISTGYVPIIVS
jgi:hypothetical protein